MLVDAIHIAGKADHSDRSCGPPPIHRAAKPGRPGERSYWAGGSFTPAWAQGRVKPTTVPSPAAEAEVPYAEIRMGKPVA